MSIEVRCPNGHVLHVKDKHAGKMGACPYCSAPVRVPMPAAAQAAEPAAESQAYKSPTEGLTRREPHIERSEAHKDTSLSGRLIDTSLSGRLSDTGLSGSLSGSFFVAGKGKFCVGCGKTVSTSFTVCTRCGTPVSTYRHVEPRKEGDAIAVKINRERILDEPAAKEVADELFLIAERAGQQNLLLDLSKVGAMSSLMLGKLVMLQRKLLLQGRQVRLCNVGNEVREVLAATKLDRVLRLAQSGESA